MVIEVDLSTVPPGLALREADDMQGFSVSVNRPEHTFVDREQLLAVAADRARDPQWQEGLEAMLAYADSKGWIRGADGAIQAHLDWQ
jgi:hypothetical protein